jgi:hypothetical protein
MTWWTRPPCLLRTVIVNLKSRDDEALSGVLWSARGGWFVLKHVVAIKEVGDGATQEKPVTGDVVIARDNVAFFQVR